jgi:hypothetical protein
VTRLPLSVPAVPDRAGCGCQQVATPNLRTPVSVMREDRRRCLGLSFQACEAPSTAEVGPRNQPSRPRGDTSGFPGSMVDHVGGAVEFRAGHLGFKIGLAPT